MGVARQLPRDVGDLLRGKRLRIQVRDARVTFDFTWTGAAFAPRARHAETRPVHRCLRTRLSAAGQRQQRPDTLFFNRRLVMEGDTELGLVVERSTRWNCPCSTCSSGHRARCSRAWQSCVPARACRPFVPGAQP